MSKTTSRLFMCMTAPTDSVVIIAARRLANQFHLPVLNIFCVLVKVVGIRVKAKEGILLEPSPNISHESKQDNQGTVRNTVAVAIHLVLMGSKTMRFGGATDEYFSSTFVRDVFGHNAHDIYAVDNSEIVYLSCGSADGVHIHTLVSCGSRVGTQAGRVSGTLGLMPTCGRTAGFVHGIKTFRCPTLMHPGAVVVTMSSYAVLAVSVDCGVAENPPEVFRFEYLAILEF